ncbi:MAG: hypothetical protein LJE69_16680 [Thiohalocapsa sp.]|uniref:hypothetical protein n=1 Tax=Thiohalocapsa sp. TaxID=2497641 RepID=UPI0025E8654B|nr:hypothetical protein [Thiohalocapsa sp.]MCG6942873.1 hypothetical protein [Thiohalocapsa sp.]
MSTTPAFVPLGTAGLAAETVQGSADLDPRLTRSRYFDGRLLTADDLTRDQIYLDRRLREFGRVVGSGVVQGLAAVLDTNTSVLTVAPGLGISGAGRVLELTDPLTVDLGDRAAIASLNAGEYTRLPRGLYALVLKYAEQGDGRAEVFPTDLAAPRTGQYAITVEGATLGLVPIPGASPIGQPLAIRAELMARAAVGELAIPTLPEDGLPLGVLAIADDRPQWLDPELLRQPARTAPDPDDVQWDLHRRYQALLADVLARRRAGGLGADFPAAEYFPLLPPAGSAPKDAFDPVSGRQGFFPEQYNVWISPIRRADLDLVLRESMPLPPLNLSAGGSAEGADIIVLAPLGNLDFGRYATALESAAPKPTDTPPRLLPRLDPLSLRLNPLPARHQLDLDTTTWQAIWALVPQDGLRYVRRPTRTAETTISGIVLARGSSVPAPDAPPGDSTSTPPATPTEVPERIVDENALLLERLDWTHLGRLRPPQGTAATDAFKQLRAGAKDDADTVYACAELLMVIGQRYDAMTWQTLLALAKAESLRKALDLLVERLADTGTAAAMAQVLKDLGADTDLRKRWDEAARAEA